MIGNVRKTKHVEIGKQEKHDWLTRRPGIERKLREVITNTSYMAV